MPMSNLSRIKRMTKDELAAELDRIRASEVLPYIDFTEWLTANSEDLLPHGRKVHVEILIKERSSGRCVDITETDCIIISDNDNLFGMRFYSIYDFLDSKIKAVPFDCLEIVRWYGCVK